MLSARGSCRYLGDVAGDPVRRVRAPATLCASTGAKGAWVRWYPSHEVYGRLRTVSFFPNHSDSVLESSLMGEPAPVQRNESVGRFPCEFGWPVSIPERTITLDDFALAFDQFLVFRPGFFLTLRVIYRDPRSNQYDHTISDSFVAPTDQMQYSARLLWGIELEGGRKGYGVPMDGSDADFGILNLGGGRDEISASYKFWVHAVPTPTMKIFVAWPARGIGETSILLDASSLVAASARETRVPGWQ